MGLCIYFQSKETMHPALAFEIRQQAEEMSRQYLWIRWDAPRLVQHTDGFLAGNVFPYPDLTEKDEFECGNLPDGDLMTMIEILCALSRDHDVDWVLRDDYGPHLGEIRQGVSDEELCQQIETLECIAELIERDGESLDECDFGPSAELDHRPGQFSASEEVDDGPRLLKFPTGE